MNDFPISVRNDGRFNVPLPSHLISMIKINAPSGESTLPSLSGEIGEWMADNCISYEVGATFRSIILETETDVSLFQLRWRGAA